MPKDIQVLHVGTGQLNIISTIRKQCQQGLVNSFEILKLLTIERKYYQSLRLVYPLNNEHLLSSKDMKA